MCCVVPQQIQRFGSTVFENRGGAGQPGASSPGGDVLHKDSLVGTVRTSGAGYTQH